MAATGYDLQVSNDYTETNPELGALFAEHIEIVAARHDHALERAGASHAIIYSGNPKNAFLDDYQMPFKPNPHFVHWLPLTHLPFSYIIYTPGERPVLVYFQPHDYWHVVPGEPDGYWCNAFDIRIVHTVGDIEQQPMDEMREALMMALAADGGNRV